MNKSQFHQIQAIELRRLITEAQGDPILTPQLENRLKSIEHELKSDSPAINQDVEQPRTAIFFRGHRDLDSHGIKPSFAGEA